MINKTFGKLTVISEQIKVHNGKRYRTFRECVCECGTKTRVREDNLKSGNTEHCGCLQPIPSTIQRNLNDRISALEKENKELRSLSLWSIRRLHRTYKDFAYGDYEKVTGESVERL